MQYVIVNYSHHAVRSCSRTTLWPTSSFAPNPLVPGKHDSTLSYCDFDYCFRFLLYLSSCCLYLSVPDLLHLASSPPGPSLQLHMVGFPSFKRLSNIPLFYTYIYIYIYIFVFIDAHLGCFHVLATVNNVYGCFLDTMAELSSRNRNHMAYTAYRTYYLALYAEVCRRRPLLQSIDLGLQWYTCY